MEWIVYIIRCDDGSLYTGITTNLARRMNEHGSGSRGARYFSGRKPIRIEYREAGHTRSTAGRREAEIKKMKRADKLILIASAAERGGGPC